MAKASKKSGGVLKKIASTQIGDTGIRGLNGFIYEEYNSKLRDRAGIEIYDEMRKSDGTVQAAVRALTLPILSARWYVKPASEDEADKEIADHVADCLFEYQIKTWNHTLRHALLSLPFGVIAFEKVYAIADIEGTPRIILDKFAPRMPRSITRWAIGSVGQQGEPGITQQRSDGNVVEIPMDKLVVIVNEMEGDNWWGSSILRPAYKHWFFKNTLYKIDGIAAERQGLGIPYVKIPDGASDDDVKQAEMLLKNIRANSQAYMVEPAGYEMGFKDMMAKSTRDLTPSIDHHNREIVKSVLAQFLELGATSGSGSRSLSEDHSELFMLSLTAVAQNIADAFNKYAIKELVDLNFDNVTDYPQLTFSDIDKVDTKALADTYEVLTRSKGVQPGVNDEQYFRELLGLPERDPNEDPIDTAPQDTSIDPAVDPEEAKKQQDMKAHEGPQKKKISASDALKPYRALTFAEQKVDFESIQKQLDKMEAEFTDTTRDLLHQANERFMKALTKAAHDGDTAGIKAAGLKVEADYAKILKSAMKSAFEYGKNNVAKEIGVTAPANPQQRLQQIDIQAAAIAQQQINEIASEAKMAYVEAMSKGVSVTAALAAADAAAQDAIDLLTSDTSQIVMSAYVNHGRASVYDANASKIYGLQRSEILDQATCNYCLSVDGRVVEKEDGFSKNTIFHSNCRGIWVSILMEEDSKPKIGGIPQGLRDRFGDVVNDLMQPTKPQVKKGSPAAKEAQIRVEEQ